MIRSPWALARKHRKDGTCDRRPEADASAAIDNRMSVSRANGLRNFRRACLAGNEECRVVGGFL